MMKNGICANEAFETVMKNAEESFSSEQSVLPDDIVDIISGIGYTVISKGVGVTRRDIGVYSPSGIRGSFVVFFVYSFAYFSSVTQNYLIN